MSNLPLRAVFASCVVATCACASFEALAQDPISLAGTVQWTCAYEGGEFHEVLCQSQLLPSGNRDGFALRPIARDPYWEDVLGADAPGARRGLPGTLQVAATVRPGRDFRPVATRGNDAIFAAGGWRVPLFSRPSDMARVASLLQDVLCGRAPDCAVRLMADARIAAH